MGRLVSWVTWHGPYRTENSFGRAIEAAEKDEHGLKKRARLYVAVGRQKRFSIRDSAILYLGKSDDLLSTRAITSLFDEKKIRGLLNEYWFGEIKNSLDDKKPNTFVSNTECALIYFLDPLRNKQCVFPVNPFSFRILNEFKKPWYLSIFPTALERYLPKMIDHDFTHDPPIFRVGSFSYSLTWRKKANLHKRRSTGSRDTEESNIWRQRLIQNEPLEESSK